MKSVGIDIGSNSIKVVEIQTSSKGYSITQSFEHVLGVNQAHDPELEIIEYLRGLIANYDEDSTRFNVGIKEDRVVTRFKEFPFADRLKIAKSLPFEMEEELPFSSENAIFDGRIIRQVGTSAEVLACATPKTAIRLMLQRSADSGFEPYVVSGEALAYSNILELWQSPPVIVPAAPPALDETQRPERILKILLHIGHSQTIVCAFEGTSMISARTIMWGGRQVADAIAKKYSLPFAEAKKEMELKAFILTTQQANSQNYDVKIFSDTIAKSIRELVRDLQLSILEIKAEFNATITNIDMTGGVSNIQGLGPFLTQNLELPCNKLQVLDLFPNVMIEKTDVTQMIYPVAIGLAIEGLRKPRNPALNFMRLEFQKQNHYFKNLWARWGKTIQVSAALIVILFIYTNIRETVAMNLADRAATALKTTAKTVAGLSGKAATETNIKKFIRENKKKAADLKALANLANLNSGADILRRLSEVVPAKAAVTLDVQRFYLTDRNLKIEGFVSSPRELNLLQQSLVSMSADGKIQARTSNLPAKAGQTAFAFELQVDRGVKEVR